MNRMDYSELFAAIDAKPFRPFRIELVSGREVEVIHPENIAVLPTRQRVSHIEVYRFDPYDMALLWPEGIVGLRFTADQAPPAA